MTTHKNRGHGRDSGESANQWLALEDVVERYVRLKGTDNIGLCWGGRPAEKLDTPDMLYVTIQSEDYRVPASLVQIWETPTMVTTDKSISLDFPDKSAEAS